MEERHLISAKNILQTIRYINIATVCEDGSPWNTPVAASHDDRLNFFWGSSRDNIHSQNIRRDGIVFVTIYDSTAAEGVGEALYMRGKAEEIGPEAGTAVFKYMFTPERLWINDDAKNEDGSYKHDIRVEIPLDLIKDGNVELTT